MSAGKIAVFGETRDSEEEAYLYEVHGSADFL